ncbi:MAG: radical SAM protein [Clostridiales bacterium]
MPKSANLIITSDCNMRCRHCYYSNDLKNIYEVKSYLKELKYIIDKLIMFGTEKFILTGGEATLSLDLLEVINYIKEKDGEVIIFSNGYNISNKIIDCCDKFSLSLDGDRNQHNYLRNNTKSFDYLINTLDILDDERKQLYIQTTITKMNINIIDSLIPIYIKYKNILKQINLVGVINTGNVLDNNELVLHDVYYT